MDLSPQWIKENLQVARNDLVRAEVAYCSLTDKRTKYAEGIARMIEAKRKIVDIWLSA